MTNDEFQVYQEILQSYDSKMQPETFFQGLFETDKDGIIIFLKPPSGKQFTFQVFLFLESLMIQQHLRLMYAELDAGLQILNDKFSEINDLVERLKGEVKENSGVEATV